MFGKRLKALRESKAMTQGELGKEINVAPSTIGMYERNQRKPDYDILQEIATYFDVSSDYLLGLSNNNKSPIADKKNDIFIARLKQIMVEKDLSEEMLAEVIGTHVDTIRECLSGEYMPSSTMLSVFATKLNVSADYLLGITNVRKPIGNISENKVLFTVNTYDGEQEAIEIPAEDFENTYLMIKAISDKNKKAEEELEAERQKERKAAKKGFFNWNK